MESYLNIDKIIALTVNEPYVNCGEPWDLRPDSKWQLVFVLGYTQEGYPIREIIEKESLSEISDIISLIKSNINLISI